MTNNDILRRIRYTFDFGDADMIRMFAHSDHEVTRAEVSNWLKKDDDPDYKALNDKVFALFLNGLITEKKGPKEGPKPEPETSLNNNIVLRKLRIALDIQSDVMLKYINTRDLRISKHELSAFFRRPDHKHFRTCKDQILRNFLAGMQQEHRPR